MDLYHLISDADCAQVRKRVVDLGLQEQVNFRNIGNSDDAKKDLLTLAGNQTVPALALFGALLTGKDAIIDYLEQMARDPAFTLYPEFDQHAESVWQDVSRLIPEELQKGVRQIQFLIQDEPTPEQVAELPEDLQDAPDELCGLFVGTPLTEASVIQPEMLPPQVFLFRFALLDLIDPTDREPLQSLKQEIAITLLHEIGHHFGLSEEDLDRLGYS